MCSGLFGTSGRPVDALPPLPKKMRSCIFLLRFSSRITAPNCPSYWFTLNTVLVYLFQKIELPILHKSTSYGVPITTSRSHLVGHHVEAVIQQENQSTGKRLMPKNRLQVILLIAVSIWLVYQLGQACSKRRPVALAVEINCDNRVDGELIQRRRLGRKVIVELAGNASQKDAPGISGHGTVSGRESMPGKGAREGQKDEDDDGFSSFDYAISMARMVQRAMDWTQVLVRRYLLSECRNERVLRLLPLKR